MLDYNEALKRPFSDWKKLVIGLILSVIPILNFISNGYQLKCAKTAARKGKNMYMLPEWSNFGNLFLVGIVSILITIIYLIPTLIATFIVGGRSVFYNLNNLTYEVLGFGAVIIAVLALLTVFVLPMSLTKYAVNERFNDAFRFGEIFRKSLTWKYIAAWLFTLVVLIVLNLVLSWLKFTLAGYVINIGGSFAGFISMVIGFTLFGRVYSETK